MITNEWFLGTADLTDPMSVRYAVFVDEQGVPESEEEDADDEKALHLVLRDGERSVAAGRLWHDGRSFMIGRVAVLRDSRRQGLGDLLVKLLLLKAFEYNPSEVRIHAQTQCEGFYARYGFVADGGPFMECGIEHIPMKVTRETLTFPSKCGNNKHFSDFFEEVDQQVTNSQAPG